jgi:putative flippase GtrA
MINKDNLSQLIRFGAVGCINTAIDWMVYFLIINISPAGIPFLFAFAKSFSYSCGIVNSFFHNRFWTFKTTPGKNEKTRFFKFFLVNMVGLGINTASFIAFLNITSLQLLSLFLATGIAFIANFSLNKYWVFRKSKMGANP